MFEEYSGVAVVCQERLGAKIHHLISVDLNFRFSRCLQVASHIILPQHQTLVTFKKNLIILLFTGVYTFKW